MNSSDTEPRKHVVNLAKDLSEKETLTLHAKISSLQGLLSLTVETRYIEVEYDFPNLCLSQIWETLRDTINTSHIGLFYRLRICLFSFAEDNEREHQLDPHNWDTYVEDIYVYYYDYAQTDDDNVRKKMWRRYKANSSAPAYN